MTDGLQPSDAPVLWTAWCDYFATGEGRSIMACIGYARNEAEIRKRFADTFDDWWEKGCETAPGVVHNEYTAFLWSDAMLNYIAQTAEKRGWVDAHAWIHVNFS
jgi:hypothetical protein